MNQAIIERSKVGTTAFTILGAITFCHLLNDVIQALLPAIYPMLKSGFRSDVWADRSSDADLPGHRFSPAAPGRPLYGSQATAILADAKHGMHAAGHVTLALAPSFRALLVGAALLGIGNAIFHPESSRLARLASGGAHGLAQSLFQVGGNVGHALGPLLAAFFILPRGQASLAWFALVALVGMAS